MKQIKEKVVSEKFYITKSNDIGGQGPGLYVLQDEFTGKVIKCITYTGTESRVDESQKKLTDIHELLEPAIRNGLLRHAIQYESEYDDIPAITYQDALDTVAKASEMFDALPVKIRNRFNNDPKQFLEFTSDPKNADEMQKLGMLKGNDGLTINGQPSGAPTATDKNGDGIKDTNTDGSFKDGQPGGKPEPG
jgi:phage internal scaffolding protein